MSTMGTTPSSPGFPMNVVAELKTAFEEHMPDHTVLERAIRPVDPNRVIGLFAVDVVPQQPTAQIGQREPAVNAYNYRIQNFVKHSDEILGKAWFSFDAKTIRAVLYRDHSLALRLAALTEEILGTREVAKRWGVSRQRFLSNEIQGQFVYLAQTDFWLESESIEL